MVCGTCSSNKIIIPEFEEKGGSRVCNDCYTIDTHGAKVPVQRSTNQDFVTPKKASTSKIAALFSSPMLKTPTERKIGFASHRLSFGHIKALDEDDKGNKIIRENVQNHIQLQEIAALHRSEMEQAIECEKALKYVFIL